VGSAVLGDPAVRRGRTAGLADPGVQTEIGDQLLGATKAPEVADCCDERECDGRVDARDRHQSLDLVALERDASQRGVDDPQLLPLEVELAQQRLDRLALITRKILLGQPGPALDPEQVRERAARDQVAMQDRLHLVLQPGALAHDMRPPGDLPAQRVRRFISDPHTRQIVGGQKLREDPGVDLVGLDLRLRDRPGLHRVGHHHTSHSRLDHPHDRVRVARRLDRDLILRAEAVGEHSEPLAGDRDLPGMADPTVFPHRDLREITMHVQANAPASHTSPPDLTG